MERKLQSTLVNLTRNQAQVDELLAPVSSFLQAALLKQVLAEYGINPTNTTSNSDPQLDQIREAIVRIDNTLNQILCKLNMTTTDSNGYSPSSLLTRVRRSRHSFPTAVGNDYYCESGAPGHYNVTHSTLMINCGMVSNVE